MAAQLAGAAISGDEPKFVTTAPREREKNSRHNRSLTVAAQFRVRFHHLWWPARVSTTAF
jgi:hypothetical protein